MARLVFPSDREVRLFSPRRAAVFASAQGLTATVYSDEDGTVLADVQNYDGTANAGATFTVDSNSELPLFLGPADGSDSLYLRVNNPGAPVVEISAVTDAASLAAALADVTAALAGKQPLDSDLTAIAALATTAFGRSLLTAADAAAGKTLLEVSGGSPTGALVFTDSDDITEAATAAHEATFAITAADSVAGSFTVAGDHLLDFPAGLPLTVTDSTGNDGDYTVNGSATLVDGHTVFLVAEPVTDDTADGTITTTTGRYDWTVTIPAGAWLVGLVVLPIAGPWAADIANVCAVDSETDAYYIELGDLNGAEVGSYSLVPGDGYSGYLVGGLSWTIDQGNLSADLAWNPGAGSNEPLPVGRLYATGGTVTVRITTTIASGPVTPSGVARCRAAWIVPNEVASATPVVA